MYNKKSGPSRAYFVSHWQKYIGNDGYTLRQARQTQRTPNFSQQGLWRVWSCALCQPGSCRSSPRDMAFWAPGDRPASASAQSSIHSENTALAHMFTKASLDMLQTRRNCVAEEPSTPGKGLGALLSWPVLSRLPPVSTSTQGQQLRELPLAVILPASPLPKPSEGRALKLDSVKDTCIYYIA